MINALLAIFRANPLLYHFASNSAFSIGLKLVNAVLGLSISIILARQLGTDGFGVYSFAMAIVLLACIPAQIGVPQLAVRETAAALAKQEFPKLLALWAWSLKTVLLLSGLLFCVGLLGLLASWPLDWFDRLTTVSGGLLCIPLVALLALYGSKVRGLGGVILGQFPGQVVRPLAFVFLLLLLPWISVTTALSPLGAMALFGISAAIALLTGTVSFEAIKRRKLTKDAKKGPKDGLWQKAIIPVNAGAKVRHWPE